MNLDRAFFERAMPVSHFAYRATRLALNTPIKSLSPPLAFAAGATAVVGPLVTAKSAVVEALALPLRVLVGTRVRRDLSAHAVPTDDLTQRGLLSAAGDWLHASMGRFAGAAGAKLAVLVGSARCDPSAAREQAWRGHAAQVGARVGAVLRGAIEVACGATNVAIYAASVGVNAVATSALVGPLAVAVGAGCALHQALMGRPEPAYA